MRAFAKMPLSVSWDRKLQHRGSDTAQELPSASANAFHELIEIMSVPSDCRFFPIARIKTNICLGEGSLGCVSSWEHWARDERYAGTSGEASDRRRGVRADPGPGN
jgi:hypothetical protein